MKKQLTKIALAASLVLAMAFTLSCSSDNNKDDGNNNGGTSGDKNGTFADSRDGKSYKFVNIGTQIWMAENLNYDVPSNDKDACYNEEPANCATYGRLYNWSIAINVCPSGWHLPSQAEWDLLANYIQSDKGCTEECDAKHLKAKSEWSNNGNGLDSYGFAALPGGRGGSDGSFYYAFDTGGWWSASERDSDRGYGRVMVYNLDGAGWDSKSKDGLYSVRCVQN